MSKTLQKKRSNMARLDHNACIPDCERLDGHLWSVLMVKKTWRMGKFHISKTTQNLGSCYGPVSFWEVFPGNVFWWVRLDELVGFDELVGWDANSRFFHSFEKFDHFSDVFFFIFFAGSFFTFVDIF